MTRLETSTIREVRYKSKGYYEGLNYLLKKHPKNFHLKSCYEGFSFINLARCITYDKHQMMQDLSEYFDKPRRFVAYSASGDITGIMVTASFPEFYQYIDYENYYIIGAQTISGYRQFLKCISTKNRAEIITFKNAQIKEVKSKFHVKNIHAWSVYSHKNKGPNRIQVKVRLMKDSDTEAIKHLPIKLSDELSPLRSLKFQLKGLPYKNYIVSFEGTERFYVGIRTHSTGVSQIDYVIATTDNTLLPDALLAIGKKVSNSGSKLIWRLRHSESIEKSKLISKSGFVKSMKEKHLHLCLDSKR